jgi:hypothetical protein
MTILSIVGRRGVIINFDYFIRKHAASACQKPIKREGVQACGHEAIQSTSIAFPVEAASGAPRQLPQLCQIQVVSI